MSRAFAPPLEGILAMVALLHEGEKGFAWIIQRMETSQYLIHLHSVPEGGNGKIVGCQFPDASATVSHSILVHRIVQ
jgi:hypothetical protein